MAEAVLGIVIENLNSLIQKEVALFLGFDQDLKRLASLFTTVKATLEDAEEKQFSNTAIKDWLGKLKEAAYILDDILDECSTEALQLEYQGVNCGLSDKVQCSCLSSFHPRHVAFRYKLAKRMKSISERLKEIAEERTNFHLTEMDPERRSGVTEWRQTSSFITEPEVYGREQDRDKIVDFLVGDASHSEDLAVYPIVGLGGLGKTTLAQFIFNNERVVKHFELKLWVCVSEDFSLKRITKAIIEEASKRACEDLDLQLLQRKVQDLLQNKRYLLVLDDVWDDEQENWQRLKSVLACGGEGTCILVTTRLPKVASIMGTMPPHELSLLPENDCWELFKHRAFGPNEVERAELVVIGKEIIKKCGGVPLAAKALGSLLRFKREEKEWLFVKESSLWSLPQNENSIMPALRLSYLNLPIKLRQCFSYCAIFPKDEKIEKQHLIELWMANGFISSNEILDAEGVGEGVWHELYWRSFFQDTEKDSFGKVKSFKIHDLVHDLAQFVAEEVLCITSENGVTTLSERIHHLSDHNRRRSNSIQLHQVKSLRTYLLPNLHGDQLSSDVLTCYPLRVLHLRKRGELSSSIDRLKHLRYLNLSQGTFKTLPESLCKLWNLQILKLDYCRFLQKLPISLIRLKAVQKLSLIGCGSLSSLSPQIGNLTSLRSLSTYIVGEERGVLLSELGPLKLKGDLHIKHLGKVKSVTDARDANMSSKQLNKLKLSWNIKQESELQENVEQILEMLQPNSQQLEILIVKGYTGLHFPQWMSSPSLKYLTYLELKDCGSCLSLSPFGKLPSLKELRIVNLVNVKYIYEESYDSGVVFKALETFYLNNLPNLIRLSREDGESIFPCLSTLQIFDCPKFLAEEPLLQQLHSLKDLTIYRCFGLQSLKILQHMTALQELLLSGLPNLESLPDCFENLPLLQRLMIYDCTKLECLPTSLSLSNLEILTIEDCPELEKRYKKETGEDWPKIAHIPQVEVGLDLFVTVEFSDDEIRVVEFTQNAE